LCRTIWLKLTLPKASKLFIVKNHTPTPVNDCLPRVIAVTGCDGAGKSTLSEDLSRLLDTGDPVQWVYLGQSSGNIARSIQELPLIGPPIKSYLVGKADRAHASKDSAPDTATILVIFILSHWRAHKFRRMLRLCRRGVVVVTDRYPQAEVPGFYFDGPGLGALNAEGWLARKLVEREQRLYQWMASHVPTLLIRLNIDADTAHLRKPDHKLSMLRDKVAVIPKLNFNGAHILDLDGTDPYDPLLDVAMSAAKTALGAHQG
jgi:thymidylate kinase